MLKSSCVASVVLVISLVLLTATSGRFIQNTDERVKRQIGDLRTAEYLARITLDKNKMLRFLQMPSHCADVACGLVDVYERLEKRTMSDQRMAELQAMIALRRGLNTFLAHGQIDPLRIGKRKKRSMDSLEDGMNDEQKHRLLNILMVNDEVEPEQLTL